MVVDHKKLISPKALVLRATNVICTLSLLHFIYTTADFDLPPHVLRLMMKDTGCLYGHGALPDLPLAQDHNDHGIKNLSDDDHEMMTTTKEVAEEEVLQSSAWIHNFSSDVNTSTGSSAAQPPPPLKLLLRTLVKGEDGTNLDASGFACDANDNSIVCVASKRVRINTSTMQVHLQPSVLLNYMLPVEVRPYARQEDKDLLQYIMPVKILTRINAAPRHCDYNHGVPAVIFSSDGFTGNLFHEFNEIIIPLFLTSRLFESQVQFIIVDYKPYFVNKYSSILSRLSYYPVLNPAQNSSMHCFPGAVVGLKFHSFLGLSPSNSPQGYSFMPNFKQFLRETYKLETRNVDDAKMMERRPVLILVARETSRKFINEDEMISMMEELGFQVIVARSKEMSRLDEFSRIVGTSSVLVGAHGAGLANEIFLPLGAVMVQVIPLGLEWASRAYFCDPAGGMGINYLGYKIGPEESTLMDLYGPDHPVITDPASIFAKGYQAARTEYLDKQNIKVNIFKFRKTLVESLRLIGRPFY